MLLDTGEERDKFNDAMSPVELIGKDALAQAMQLVEPISMPVVILALHLATQIRGIGICLG